MSGELNLKINNVSNAILTFLCVILGILLPIAGLILKDLNIKTVIASITFFILAIINYKNWKMTRNLLKKS